MRSYTGVKPNNEPGMKEVEELSCPEAVIEAIAATMEWHLVQDHNHTEFAPGMDRKNVGSHMWATFEHLKKVCSDDEPEGFGPMWGPHSALDAFTEAMEKSKPSEIHISSRSDKIAVQSSHDEEVAAAKAYRERSEESSSPELGKFFAKLASEEEEHARELNSIQQS